MHTVKNLGRGSNRENRPTTVLVHFYTSEVWMRYSDPNINSSFFLGFSKIESFEFVESQTFSFVQMVLKIRFFRIGTF